MNTSLTDTFGRKHDYLRLSLTESCNFRCLYCMPEGPVGATAADGLMNAGELYAIAELFVRRLGITKIRLTGGEPLVRHDFGKILDLLASLQVQLALTTNGVLLDKYFDRLQEAKVKDINISIDSLDRQKFREITRRDLYPKVWENIQESIKRGFTVKLNAVIMRGLNDNEIPDLVALSHYYPVEVRFIEFMPFSGNAWEKGKVIGTGEMLYHIGERFDFVKLDDAKSDTSRKYRLNSQSKGTFAFITTMSHAFCSGCNRIRVTPDGKMKNCLFGAEEFDLLTPLRAGRDIEPLIREGILRKHREKGGQFDQLESVETGKITNRSMVRIGG